MTRAQAKARLRSDEPLIGTMFLEAYSHGICHLIKHAGFDFVIFDTEHSWYGVETITGLIRNARDIGLIVIVRAPAFQGNWPARYFDLGADGIVFPHVDDAAQAADIIRQVKYPPVGERGMAGGIAHDAYSAAPAAQYTPQANEELLVIVQIETAAGLRNREAILATPGVDAVFIGPNDLALSMGYPGQLDHPEVVGAMDDILQCAASHGVAPGLHCFGVENTRHWIGRGARFVCHRSDISLIVDGGRADLAQLR